MTLSKSATHRGSIFYPSSDLDKKTGMVFFSISLFFHGLFFTGMLLFNDFKMPKPMPPVIQIDLVSFSPEPVGLDEEPSETMRASENVEISTQPQTPVKKAAPEKIPNIKPDISLKTKPKNLKQLLAHKQEKKKEKLLKKKEPPEKKKEASKEKSEDPAEKPDEKAEDQQMDQITQALSRLEKKVLEQGKSKTAESNGAAAGYGKKGYKPIDLYHLVIGSTIEQNWVFNDILAKMDQNLEVRILIKVLKSGEIRDIIYETRSGNRYLDESAKKAVKKANPLPPLPAGLHSYDVGLIFTPKGLK